MPVDYECIERGVASQPYLLERAIPEEQGRMKSKSINSIHLLHEHSFQVLFSAFLVQVCNKYNEKLSKSHKHHYISQFPAYSENSCFQESSALSMGRQALQHLLLNSSEKHTCPPLFYCNHFLQPGLCLHFKYTSVIKYLFI